MEFKVPTLKLKETKDTPPVLLNNIPDSAVIVDVVSVKTNKLYDIWIIVDSEGQLKDFLVGEEISNEHGVNFLKSYLIRNSHKPQKIILNREDSNSVELFEYCKALGIECISPNPYAAFSFAKVERAGWIVSRLFTVGFMAGRDDGKPQISPITQKEG